MKRIVILAVFCLAASAWGEKPQIKILQSRERYNLSAQVSAFGKHQDILLPGVTAHLFSGNKLMDSTRLDTGGSFAFQNLGEGEYDLAFSGNLYFPKKICEIKIDSSQKVYPSVELQDLEEKYPDSTWRPERYLYVTFKSDLTEDEIIRRLDWEYDVEILPFNNNSVLRPILRYDGTQFYRATIVLSEGEKGIDLANRLILDPYVYQLEPDLLLPFPPAIKTNQKPRVGNK